MPSKEEINKQELWIRKKQIELISFVEEVSRSLQLMDHPRVDRLTRQFIQLNYKQAKEEPLKKD